MSENLRQLRVYAESGDATQCALLIEPLLCEINSVEIFRLALDQLQPCLSIFETLHPQITWPREYLGTLKLLEPIDYALHKFEFYSEERITDENGFPHPISSAFIEALGLIDSAFRVYITSGLDGSIGLVADTISVAIGVRKMASWAARDPSNFGKWYNLVQSSLGWQEPLTEEQLSQANQIKQIFPGAPILKCIVRELFLDIAEKIEQLLKPNSQEKDLGM